MRNFERILQEKGKTVYDIGRAMGHVSTPSNLTRLKKGITLISECDFATVSFIANYLGVEPNELLEPYESDGSFRNIRNLENFKNRMKKKFDTFDDEISYKTFNVKKVPFLGIIVDGDETKEIIIKNLETQDSWRAVYTISDDYQELEIFKKVSDSEYKETPQKIEPSLKMETPQNNEPSKNLKDTTTENTPVLNDDGTLNKDIITLLREDLEGGDIIDYYQFIDEMSSVIYALSSRKI